METDKKIFVGKVYKIVSDSTDKVYYGSTKQPLYKRLYGHKSTYNRYLKGKRPGKTTSFEIMKFGDAQIFLVEELECTSKEQLHARERFHIESNECVNHVHPGRTAKELYAITSITKEFKDANNSKAKEWYKNNTQHKHDYDVEYRAKNKDKKRINDRNYRLNNVQKLKDYHKKYRISYEKKIKKITTCECGKTYNIGKSSTHKAHLKTIKHKNYINSLYFD